MSTAKTVQPKARSNTFLSPFPVTQRTKMLINGHTSLADPVDRTRSYAGTICVLGEVFEVAASKPDEVRAVVVRASDTSGLPHDPNDLPPAIKALVKTGVVGSFELGGVPYNYRFIRADEGSGGSNNDVPLVVDPHNDPGRKDNFLVLWSRFGEDWRREEPFQFWAIGASTTECGGSVVERKQLTA